MLEWPGFVCLQSFAAIRSAGVCVAVKTGLRRHPSLVRHARVVRRTDLHVESVAERVEGLAVAGSVPGLGCEECGGSGHLPGFWVPAVEVQAAVDHDFGR